MISRRTVLSIGMSGVSTFGGIARIETYTRVQPATLHLK